MDELIQTYADLVRCNDCLCKTCRNEGELDYCGGCDQCEQENERSRSVEKCPCYKEENNG